MMMMMMMITECAVHRHSARLIFTWDTDSCAPMLRELLYTG